MIINKNLHTAPMLKNAINLLNTQKKSIEESTKNVHGCEPEVCLFLLQSKSKVYGKKYTLLI